MKKRKNFLLFQIVELFSKGKKAKEVAKELGITKQNLNYYIRKLKKIGKIEKVGYGTWEVKKQVKIPTKDTKSKSNNLKQIRGHAFIWKVKHKIKNWEELLIKKKINYNYIGIKKTPRVWINNKKVWLGKKHIIIYEPNSFYSENSINSKKFAVMKLLETLRELEIKLNINLKPYTFTTAREHYGYIKNDLAIQCNKKGEKIKIYDEEGTNWLWIDDSLSIGELEVGNHKKSVVISKKVQDWYNEMKETKFDVTPKFILNGFNTLTKNQLNQANQIGEFATALNKHIPAYEGMKDLVKELKDEIKGLKDEISKLKQK
ncbi:MAG: hypothetical protein ACLFPS_05880 [Clostridia bacterium]